MPDYSSYTDEALLATTAWKEARGQIKKFGVAAVLAVMHVIVNRMDAWGQSIQHVILGPNQFTSMSVSSDPEFELLPADDDPIYQQCLTEASSILDGSDPDETEGACYYANLEHIPQDGWFWRHIVLDTTRHPLTKKIGDHSFFH
jgi:hypothetical protein